MSKIAIISDIHSNVHTLELVLKDIERRGVDKIYCLGDLVTKYFYPKEVVDSIKENCEIVIKGNCDDRAATNEKYKFTRDQLGLDRIDYLDNLPTKKQLLINKVIVNLYHSNPHDIDSMFNPLFNDNAHTRYKDSTIETKDYKKMFEDGDEPQTTIVGHTHMNYIGVEENNELNIKNGSTIITPTTNSIINVGSVGEHVTLTKDKNDGYTHLINPYVTYLLLDDHNLEEGLNAEIIKIPYSDELTKIYFDSVKKQISGEFPYSPIYTERIKESLLTHDSEFETKQAIEEVSKEYEKFRKER